MGKYQYSHRLKKQQSTEALSFCALPVSWQSTFFILSGTLHCVDSHSKYASARSGELLSASLSDQILIYFRITLFQLERLVIRVTEHLLGLAC